MTTDTAALLRHLADIVSRLRHMWDDTDGDTHMPVEESDDICHIGTDLATALGCKDDWPAIATALRTHADAIAAPGLPEGWTEHLPSIGEECSVYFVEEDSTGRMVFLTTYAIGTADWSGPVAPPAVYAYLLARATDTVADTGIIG
ncbi:MAG: hypothetical protein VW362_12135, partial [Candidatus Nanopelagicales bacterium]